MVAEFFQHGHVVGIPHADLGIFPEVLMQIGQGVGNCFVKGRARHGFDQIIRTIFLVEAVHIHRLALGKGFLLFLCSQGGAHGVLNVGHQIQVGAVQDGIADADLDFEFVAAKLNLGASELNFIGNIFVTDEVVVTIVKLYRRSWAVPAP